MTVKLLRALLNAVAQKDDHLEVMVTCTWAGKVLREPPPNPQFHIATVVCELDPDTSSDRIVLECDQNF